MLCKLLEFMIEHAPEGALKDDLIAIRDKHCPKTAQADSGGTTPPGK